MPITEPIPNSLTLKLLAQHGFWLFPVADYPQSTRNVHRLGFVCRDAKLFLLDEAVRDQTIEHREHPLALATRWTGSARPHYPSARKFLS